MTSFTSHNATLVLADLSLINLPETGLVPNLRGIMRIYDLTNSFSRSLFYGCCYTLQNLSHPCILCDMLNVCQRCARCHFFPEKTVCARKMLNLAQQNTICWSSCVVDPESVHSSPNHKIQSMSSRKQVFLFFTVCNPICFMSY